MGNRFEATVDRLSGRWVEMVARRPGRVLAVAALFTAAVAVYAALRLGVDADPRSLIDRRLPFQVRQQALTETFHTLGDGILVVIDAESPTAAAHAADALAARLAARADLFTRVNVPGGGPFFARNALLYVDPDRLEDLADRLGRLQPFLAELARDQSLVGIADLLRQALAAERRGTHVGLDLATALDRVSAVVEATNDGRTPVDPWGTALLGGALPAEARQRVVELRPKLDYGTLLNAAPAVAAIRDAAQALGLGPEAGIRVRITGEPVLNYEELISIGTQTWHVAVIAFVLFTVGVCWALRSARIVLALVTGLLVSLAWSNAFAAAAVGHLNQISATFNVLIIGLGGEFGIHFCMRYAELVGAGRSRSEALVETAETIGSSLFSSACTTSIGFYIFLLTDFTGVGQMGLISGTGMFLSLAATFTVIPALLAVGTAHASAARPMAPSAFMARLEHLPLRWAGPIRVASAAVALAALALLPRVRFDYNLLRLRDPATESVATFEDLLDRAGSSPWSIDVMTPSLDAAHALAERLAGLSVVASARTVLDYVPAEQEAKRSILETASYFVPAVFSEPPTRSDAEERAALVRLADDAGHAGGEEAGLAASAGRLARALRAFLDGRGVAGGPPGALDALQAAVVGSLPGQVRDLSALLSPGHVVLTDLPPDLTEQMLAADGRARVQVFARGDLSDSAALEHFVDGVRTLAPEATGSAVWMVEWGRVTWHAMVRALVVGVVCMLVFLVLLWWSVWDSILAFFPLALATLLTCASLVLVGQPFNFANVIVLPMLIGMGVDNGVHLVHRHRTNPDEVDVLATSTARAVFYSALTTMLGFGSLAFASHRGIAGFGTLLTIGVFVTLVCYVIVLPAVLEWDDRRRRPGGRTANAAEAERPRLASGGQPR